MDSATEWRGGQQQLMYLLDGMRSRGHQVWVAAPADGALARKLGEGVLPIASGNNPLAAAQLAAHLRRLRPDVVAAHTSHAHGNCVLAGSSPVVHRRVDFAVGGSPIGRWKYRRACRYVAVSEGVARVLVAGGVPRDRIRVVHDGIEPLEQRPAAPDLVCASPLVGAVGALVDHKAHRVLVDAMALLSDVRCVIAGEGHRRAKLEAQIRRLGVEDRVLLLGQRSDVAAVFAALDLFVHPSVEEGMGQVVVEAMAAGVPVLVTDAGGLPEVVGPDVSVVSAGDAAALADAIRHRLDDPGPTAPAAARARERFSVDAMVEVHWRRTGRPWTERAMSHADWKSDCRLFTGYRPCRKGRVCRGCELYQPVVGEVLVINLDALGDVLRTTAQLSALRRAWPDARISWITQPRAVPLLQGHPLLDRILPLCLESVLELEARHFDLLLCVDKGRAACGLASRLEADEKRGFLLDPRGAIVPANEGAHYLFRTGIDDDLKFRINTHSEPWMLAKALELPYEREPYRLFLEADERVGPPRAVGFNTGSSSAWPRKRLAFEVQAQALELVGQATGEPVLLLGGPEDTERNRQLAARLGDRVELTPTDAGLRVGAAHVARCGTVVSADSLGMHMALALGCHVVAWFGPTCPQEIDLFDRGVKLLAPVDCAPCWDAGCVLEPGCNKTIEPTLVRDAVLDCILAREKAVPLAAVRGGNWGPDAR